MTDFLLELLSEEIPARMQARARNDLARMFAEGLGAAGLGHGAIETFSTPRRLALIARDVAERTEAVSEELKGPRATAPPQALEGFLRKSGLGRDQLEDRDGVWFARIDGPGRGAAEVIADTISTILADFPWPKSMRWGSGEMRWVRPLHSIVALLGEEIVAVEAGGIESGAMTVGHRFHHSGPITIGGAHDYVEKLRACHVIVDQDEREAMIREGAAAAAREAGLALIEDEGLVVENAGLTEWPVPLLGRFDADFLDVPREVIVLTMRTNQKYFACAFPPPQGEVARSAGGGTPGGKAPSVGSTDTSPEGGGLAPAFVCVANIDSTDGGAAIVEGNRRVLAARLADARFFWEQDLKVPLEEQARKLDGIVFHEKLGTVADKVERVAKLARWLVEEGIVKPSPLEGEGRLAKGERGESLSGALPHSSAASRLPPSPSGGEGLNLADLAERAARLAKADLVTGMVGEFPELQGVIGGYLAAAQGEPDVVADAIRDHYKPVGQGSEVPTAPVTVAVSLADKLDTLGAFFAAGMPPTGSKDPFALRRAALGVIAVIIENNLRFALDRQFEMSTMWLRSSGHDLSGFGRSISDFFADRLKVQQREAGVRHDLIDAVLALGGEDDLVRLLARVKALQGFVETGEGTNLLAGYKRAANILKKEEGSWTPDQVRGDDVRGEEQALVGALDAAESKATQAIEAEDFTAAMAALAGLRAPIDAFFDKVTVNADDPGVRARRLALLARFRDAVNRVADFSKIEG